MSDEGNRSEAAQLVAQCGITPNAAIAKSAIPQCNLVCLTGEEMKYTVLEDYYQVLYRADPASIGGASPMTACTICPDRLLRPPFPPGLLAGGLAAGRPGCGPCPGA